RTVLVEEKFLLPTAANSAVYTEFAAVYLELRFFADFLLQSYFPSIEDCASIDRILGQDVDAAALLAATRLLGAPDPRLNLPQRKHSEKSADEPTGRISSLVAKSLALWRAMNARAARAARRGNSVRAAILRGRSARVAPRKHQEVTRVRAREELHDLAERLRA